MRGFLFQFSAVRIRSFFFAFSNTFVHIQVASFCCCCWWRWWVVTVVEVFLFSLSSSCVFPAIEFLPSETSLSFFFFGLVLDAVTSPV